MRIIRKVLSRFAPWLMFTEDLLSLRQCPGWLLIWCLTGKEYNGSPNCEVAIQRVHRLCGKEPPYHLCVQ